MRVDNTAAGLSILAACTTDVKQWYMQNGLQLNPDKSETLFMGTATQLRAVSFLKSVSVADVDLPTCDPPHIRHLLTLDLAQTLACSLILSRIDYCNSLLHGAPSSTIQKLQRIQNIAYRSTSASTVRRQLAAPDAALAAC